MLGWWRSFWRWRKADPRPTLWQWIRGFRGSLWIDEVHLGFCKDFTITSDESAKSLLLEKITDETVHIPFTLDEITEDNMKLFIEGTQDE